jgi:cysteine desulfurase family protein (TIGR01976 family)
MGAVRMNPLTLLPRPLSALVTEPVEAQFPGLRRGSVRLDGPGGTLVHGAVSTAIANYLASEHVANDHGAFAASRFSDELVEWSIRQVSTLLGIADGTVVFGPNMTTLTSMFVRAIAGSVGPGDEIVCTELDHEANQAPWVALARDRDATVRMATLSPSGVLASEAIIDQITARTRWVAVTSASNALGTMPDIATIVAAAHAVHARVYVDGVQTVAHRPVDLAKIGCDGFVTSPYKWYGPHCGVLVVRDELAHQLRLAEQVPSAGSSLPGRLELGTTNFEAVLGTGVAAAVMLGWDRVEIQTRETKLTELLISRLLALPRVRLLGPDSTANRVPVVSFQVDGREAAAVATALASAGISLWHGTFYASAAMRAVGAPAGALRAGITAYTTESDVEALAVAIAAA